jgi:hypothetical protein
MIPKIYLYTKFIGIPQTQKFYPVIDKKFFQSYDNYINHLFDEQRIISRLFFFKKLTIPTILGQTNQNFEWIIFISSLLPVKYKEFIRSISEKILVIETNQKIISNQELAELHSPKESNYISVRLDDDDGLCIDYFELLLKKYSSNNLLIGSKNILIVTNYEKNLVYSKTTKNFLVSSGFSSKNKHVYDIGGHAKAQYMYSYDLIDKKYPSIQSGGEHTFTKRDHVSNVCLFNLDKFINNEYE